MTFESYSTRFFDWNGDYATDRRVTGKRISRRQCTEKTALLNNRIIPALGKLKLIDIDRSTIKQLRNDLFREGVSGATINKCLSCIRAILESAEDKRLIQAIPRIERAAEQKKSRGILKPDEAKALFLKPWPDIRAYTANILAAATGLRQGEILALQRQNVKTGYLEILRGWNQRTGELNETTKSGRARYVPIPEKVEVAIHELIEISPWTSPESYLFFTLTRQTKPIEGRALTRGLYAAMRGIGIHDQEREARWIDFHSWRHWFNSIMINQ
ncbi:MAG: tyrosine-type recombinase/integrase, partial [Planctomycetes bacterium]|nr:tyrosine-type recombinase/integrase [Planctomycetota bacterium]